MKMSFQENFELLLLGYPKNSKRTFDSGISEAFEGQRGKFKKEYLRCKLIRGHKRIMRQIKAGKIPKIGLNCYDKTVASSSELFQLLKNCYNENKSKFNQISMTENGPITVRNKNESASSITNSFNKLFCRSYFKEIIVRRSYYYYVEYIFSNFDPETLCEKFKINCCKNHQHSNDCKVKWSVMKSYISEHLIEEIGLQPWKPENPCSRSIPNIFANFNP